MGTKKVWFITGASKGFGLEFINQLLAKGDAVAATSRSLSQLQTAANTTHENFLPLEVDLVNEQSVAKAIEATIAKFGRIDNIVNNAGYGLLGTIEELTDAESRQNFEVNVFGSLNVIRQALPHLRAQKSGHIFNISSIGGFVGDFPGFGIYCATKFAVNGFSESLAEEVKDFNINVTIVMPGYFRTNFLESDSLVTPKNVIADYQSTRDSQNFHQNQMNGNQPGDPVKGVSAIIEAAGEANPPLYLFLGSDSVTMAEKKINMLSKEIDKWKALSTSTDF
ncbi:SDR family NAD(P)-dependent oxidoreductase [Flavobacterium sp. J372]|uniref:oxidoreductase n=1 Tax=Flavobacterium sp. J372 TaxID=2898436 RepID=UPI0021508BB1|nr:oxidoreductase [Flavobacterium sp. J372]MCR5863115.1 SDR family NAD(P)-dependent oxidoreductase [Flavobacterium sp. J372]